MKQTSRYERVNQLKQQYENFKPTLHLDLAKVKTEVMEETAGEPMCIRRAKAFKKYCETKEINILPGELIVGNTGAWPRQAEVTPEVSADWITEELDTMSTRQFDPLQIDEESKKLWREEIAPYWKGKTVLNQWLTRIPSEVKEIGYKSGIIDAEIKTQTGPGELALGYGNILIPQGYGGIKKHAEEIKSTLDLTNFDDIGKNEYLQSVVIMCDAMEVLGERHADKAKEMAAQEKDTKRKAELLDIANRCSWIASKPPRSFADALQLIWFSQVGLFLELSAPSYSLGRFDQYMNPLLQADLKEGRTTEKDALEILECTWIKMAEQLWYLSEQGAMYYSGYTAFQNTMIGGIDKDGSDAVNDVSYMVLTASKEVKLCQPPISVRVNKKNPDKFLKAVAELVQVGTGFPAVHSDAVGIPNLIQKGIPEEEAWDWCAIGCVEPSLAGKLHQWSTSASWNFGAAIEFAMTNGVHRMSGGDYGIRTGDPNDFKTFDDYYEAVKAQVAYLIKVSSVFSNITEIAQMELCPAPLTSMLVEGCVETGTDIMAGGAKYNVGPGTLGIGVADACNSLAAIKKLVYDDKKITFDELNKALDADFEGYERVRQMLMNDAPKYGNDDPYVDTFAKELAEFVVDEHHKYKTMNGEYFMPSLYPVSSNIPQGMSVGALPTGRKAGEALADGCSPCHGTELEGPTAVLKSYANIDGTKVDGGMLLNIKFDPATVGGDEGADRIVNYLKAFRDLDVYEVQFNVLNKEILNDALENPDEYKSLLVRVAGYSAYFVELSKPLQDDILGRTEFALA
ncbi:MAG: formate C-acetyltransferase/glycerol dehydratase family glycyl radical enzyme [Eubacteriaceae bacterium]|nr:formate C-acetyltransferase/glycerol dehydratase family glycyl radical enzyme [Eubacteriaceae bacterium]